MNVRKTLTVFACLMLGIFLLFGCSVSTTSIKNGESVKNDAEKQIYIPVISKGWEQQYWQSVKMGAEKAAKDYNIRITVEAPEADIAVNKQIEMIDSALSRNPDALVLAAVNSKAVIHELEKAKSLNIPVIGFDSGVNSDILVTTVATDNNSAGSLAADKMAVAIAQKGEIAVICHDAVSTTGTQRRDGFLNRIKEKYPRIEVVDVKYGNGDHGMSKKITETIIEKHPNIKGIFATNEGSAYGLINGITEKNKIGKIVIVGFDAGKFQKNAVRSGVMIGAITQDPVMVGYKAVEAAVKVLKGETLPKNIDIGYKWYDKTNVDDEKLKTLLYD
ncbi:ABC transporter substrate-binding protein [Clostridium sp.]|jgi:ribose transport system substrate-binding protein|uniref:ABC transporter substrate-binding protein n=1 Tax=Clostridium sp. TaxID=1506 RepID=UPI003EEAC69B